MNHLQISNARHLIDDKNYRFANKYKMYTYVSAWYVR